VSKRSEKEEKKKTTPMEAGEGRKKKTEMTKLALKK